MATAPQTAWAQQLATDLVDAFRDSTVQYVAVAPASEPAGAFGLEDLTGLFALEDGSGYFGLEASGGSGGGTGYNPLTGLVSTVETIYSPGAAIISRRRVEGTLAGKGRASGSPGYVESYTLKLCFDAGTLPVEPDTNGYVIYQGQRWRITQVDPILGSGPDDYSYMVYAAG